MAAQVEPKLDVYMCDDNFDNEVMSGPEDIYVDDGHEDNINRILRKNPLTVNNSVTAERVEYMLYLDTNSRRRHGLKRHQKELLLIESKHKKN